MMADHVLQRWIGPVVAIGRGQGHIAQHWRAEAVRIFQHIAFPHAPHIARDRIEPPGAPRAKGRQAKGVEGLIAEQRTRMARAALSLAKEQIPSPVGVIGQGRASQIGVPRAVKALKFRIDKGRQGGCDMGDVDLCRIVNIIKRANEHVAIFRDHTHPFCNDWPCRIDPVVHSARNFVFFGIAGHFKLRGHGKHRLCCENVWQALWQPFFGRGIEPVLVNIRNGQTPVMEQDRDVPVPQIPKGRRIARDAFADRIIAQTGHALITQARAPFANAQRQPVPGAKIVVVAGAATDVLIARQHFVIEQKLANRRLIRFKGMEILRPHGQCVGGHGAGAEQRKGEDVRTILHRAILALFACLASPVSAEIEVGRDLMEAGRFEEALEAFWPAARSGNADAEELIGVMYALGLGVEQDYVRAFEWYLRSAMKGHPGAQSGVGWYYEVGLGMPEPDLVRAYMWYVLSAIGGDPDAAISQEEVIKKMTDEQIAHANVLIDDYRVWMYPFR